MIAMKKLKVKELVTWIFLIVAIFLISAVIFVDFFGTKNITH